jgi:hypothetical protein
MSLQSSPLAFQFLQDHLVRSQVPDRPGILGAEHHDVALEFDTRQAFAYNRLLSAQALAFLTSEEALSSDARIKEFFRHLNVRETRGRPTRPQSFDVL